MAETAMGSSGSKGKTLVIAVLGLAVVGLLILLVINPPGGNSAGEPPAANDAEPAVSAEPGDSAGATEAEPAETEPSEAEPNPEYEAFLLSLADRVEGDPMAKGAVDAPVVMIQWADFQCGYCQSFALETEPQLDPLVESGQLRIEYRDVALFGEESIMVAAGARAAAQQGVFWEYHDVANHKLAAGQDAITDDVLGIWAEEAGVADLAQWESHYLADETRHAVTISSLAAQEIGVTSTPTFVIGTEVVMGAQPIEVFQDVIAQQLAKAG